MSILAEFIEAKKLREAKAREVIAQRFDVERMSADGQAELRRRAAAAKSPEARAFWLKQAQNSEDEAAKILTTPPPQR